jgi:hypothetical protein
METKSKLPKHLQECVSNYYEKCNKFGIDPDWAYKAYKKAEERGDHFNPIYGLI